MSTIDDGGRAFPHMAADGHPDYRPGIDLRDYLASRAMPAVVAKIEGQAASEEEMAAVINEVATVSYRIADAMLAAREVAA